MLNYQNDYYLDEILDRGVQTQDEVKEFFAEKFKINLNSNQSNDAFSCSSFNVYNNKNQNLFGRNFDFPVLSPTFVVWTNPPNGYRSISFVNGKYIGISEGEEIEKEKLLYSVYDIMDGCNEAGLAISFLALLNTPKVWQDDPKKKTITSPIMTKGVLDNCKNVAEAIDFFRKYNMHDISENRSLHYLITDSHGDSVIIEYIDNRMVTIKPYERENVKYSYLTNFMLIKQIGKGNENGVDRYNILKEKLKDDIVMEEDEAMNLLSKVHKNSTLWSNIYNTNELTVITAIRYNYTILYKFDLYRPNECFISQKNY
jgi:predicted choloylglycine hydrolase